MPMNRTFYLPVVSILLFVSCRKLGEKVPRVIQGKWKHIYTTRSREVWSPPSHGYIAVKTTLGPLENNTVELTCKKIIFHDPSGDQLDEKCGVEERNDPGSYIIHFGKVKKGESQYRIFIELKNDTLILNGFFPYKSTSYTDPSDGHTGGDDYTNYFVRE